ncbi:MAG TPA: methyltransferase domain-containing protein [Gaiella sp.]|nr:methyltransferase domain-containing protein [Gaiella sp.]
MTGTERWLTATWPVVRDALPAPPARVVELGCGTLGGHVPVLRAAGYDALGVDPEAPDGPEYRRVEFERLEDPPKEAAAIVASASLHHVEDPREVLAAMGRALAPGGRVIVVEWDWEAFDRPTANWCFGRLGPGEGGWLHRHRDAWAASGTSWDVYLRGWAQEHRIHPARELLALLAERFRLDPPVRGPYFFADLEGTTEDDEARAIQGGEIRAARVDVVGVLG